MKKTEKAQIKTKKAWQNCVSSTSEWKPQYLYINFFNIGGMNTPPILKRRVVKILSQIQKTFTRLNNNQIKIKHTSNGKQHFVRAALLFPRRQFTITI